MKEVIIDGIVYVPKDIKSTPKYKIGDELNDGIIFFIDDSGSHGLIAAKSDMSFRMSWYDAKEEFSIGDWRLPTKNELNLMCKNRELIGGFASNNYWSSSESSNYNAWGQYFVYGNQGYTNKNDTLYVRAVKNF